MPLKICATMTVTLLLLAAAPAAAEEFQLMTGVDAGLYPGATRAVLPPGGVVPGAFNDGDRLAGTSDQGPAIVYQGTGTPLFAPNEFGALSFIFRRGSVPIGGGARLPFMGIDFLGGPLLDLDGNTADGVRSLVPVAGQTAQPIPGSASFIGLTFDFEIGQVVLEQIDVTGTNEGAPGLSPEFSTTVNRLASTLPDGSLEEPINPDVDTRQGDFEPFEGTSGTLAGVYQISDLGFEWWYDSIDPNSSTATTLGTMQHFGSFRGWMIERDFRTGQFPLLAGEGLGSTRWPEVNESAIGLVLNTANGLAGGMAVIASGVSGDPFNEPGNGGLPLEDFDGDLGAYLDEVVVPLLSPQADRFVYLETAGYGINNSFDPIFTDTISYDIVIIAQAVAGGCGAQDHDDNGVGDDCQPRIVHGAGLAGDTRPFSGFIDPRVEFDGDGRPAGIDALSILFSEPVAAVGGGALAPSDFIISHTAAPQDTPVITAVDDTANPLIHLTLDRPLVPGTWTTVQALVENAAGHAVLDLGNLGTADEPDRVDIGFLPGDVDQDGAVGPIDLLRWRQGAFGNWDPPGGELADFLDTDRNGTIEPLDLLRYRQLLFGTGIGMPWAGETLSPRP